MTWAQTHRRLEALRETEAALTRNPERVPWRPGYEALFGTPDGLVEALRYRWRLRLQAQLDPELDDATLDETVARLRRGMPRLIAADLIPETPSTVAEIAELCA